MTRIFLAAVLSAGCLWLSGCSSTADSQVAYVVADAPISEAQPVEQSAVSASSAYAVRYCESVAFQALNLARVYLTDGRNKELFFETFGRDPATEAMASQLFQEADFGFISHHADFATNQLFSCATSEGVEVGQPREKARICLARVDIPFYLSVVRGEGKPVNEAILNVSNTLQDRVVYPSDLIRTVATFIYASKGIERDREIMSATLWTCMSAE